MLALHAESPLYRAVTKINVRMGPDVKSPSLKNAQSQSIKAGEMYTALAEGQIFEVAEVRQSQGQTYLKLAEQDGWVFTKGIAGEWSGKDIIQLVPESERMAATAKSLSDKVQRRVVRDGSDQTAVYIFGATVLSLVIYQIYDWLN